MVFMTPRDAQARRGISQYIPRNPSSRPPLPRMLSPPRISIKKSPKLREKSTTPVFEPESEGDTSDLGSEGSPEAVQGSTPTNRSPIVTRSHRTSSVASETLNNTSRNISTASDRLNKSEQVKSPRSLSKKQFQHGDNNYVCYICVAVFVIIAIIWGVRHSDAMNIWQTLDEKGEPVLNKEKLMFEALNNLGRNIDDIREKFKEQYPSIWRDLEAGIADVIKNPRKPTIFLLFSSDDDPMFCLAKMIANASKTALGSEEDLILSPEDLGEDYGKALLRLKNRIEQQKVVIVEHLLDIHPEAMKAFHNLCDRENPLVKEAIYILTMVADGYKNEEVIKFVENQLTLKLRGKIDDEKLQPLITRMTDGAIIHVQPEPGVKRCPLRY